MWMQNYAKFDSRVANEMDLYAERWMALNASMADAWWRVADLSYNIADLLAGFLTVCAVFYGLYLLITAIKSGLDEVLTDIKKRGAFIRSSLKNIADWIISRGIRYLFSKAWKNIAFRLVIVFFLSQLSAIAGGRSQLLKVDRISQWFVWVDLAKKKIIQPGYHIYSPLSSSYFTSPTNTFDFEIAEATANTSEELNVTLDRRVGFAFEDDKRLGFYNQYGAKDIRTISSDIVMPLLLESIRTVIYRYSFKDLAAQSDEIKEKSFALAQEKLKEKWIALQYMNIIDIRLPESYLKSQEDLLKAENERALAEAALETQKKQAEKELLKAENNKKMKIIEAEAVAEYNKLVSKQNISSQSIEMKKLEIAEKKIEKRNGVLPVTVEWGLEW